MRNNCGPTLKKQRFIEGTISLASAYFSEKYWKGTSKSHMIPKTTSFGSLRKKGCLEKADSLASIQPHQVSKVARASGSLTSTCRGVGICREHIQKKKLHGTTVTYPTWGKLENHRLKSDFWFWYMLDPRKVSKSFWGSNFELCRLPKKWLLMEEIRLTTWGC